MDTRTGSFTSQRVYDDFVPPQHLLQDENEDTLLLELAGFRKEQIKVQIDNYGKLRISGERPVGINKWVRFRKEHQVPENCNVSAIRAKYENGLVAITLPKLVPTQDQTTTTQVDNENKPTSQPSEPSQSSEKKEEKRSEPVTEPSIDAQKKTEEPSIDAQKTAEEPKDITSKDESREEMISSSGLEMLKKKMGGLSKSMYDSRKKIWIAFAVLVVSVGVGLVIKYNLDGNLTEADDF